MRRRNEEWTREWRKARDERHSSNPSRGEDGCRAGVRRVPSRPCACPWWDEL